MQKEKVKKLKTQGIIGAAIGLAIGIFACIEDGTLTMLPMVFLLPILFAGFPYGWQLFGKIFNFILVGPLPVMFVALLIRFICAIFLGWIAFPISLLYNTWKEKREENQEGKLNRENVYEDV